jgi:hypothetical protein
MRVFGIAIAKNEEDIIAYNLKEAAKWCERIFVLDNGSTDRTWEVVQETAREEPRIVPWRSWDTPYLEGLRAEVFNAFKHLVQEGDWWCFKLDSDEFYIDDPRTVLAKVPHSHHVVCKDSFEYRLTVEDVQEHVFNGHFPEDKDKIRYYLPHTWAEVRFFRHRSRLEWDPRSPFPRHMGIVWPGRIPAKHYQYRSPAQMQRRLDTRRQAAELAAEQHGTDHPGYQPWTHELVGAGIDALMVERKDLYFDDGRIPLRTEGPSNRYLHRPHKLLIKRVLHGLGIWP